MVKNSKKLSDGICVWFENGYHAHGIWKVGTEDEEPRSDLSSAWGWVNHLRTKRWWNPLIQADFLIEVDRHLT